MNSFNTISYNNGVLTINGTQYNIEASGNNVSGNSFSQVKLEGNKLTLNGIEITFTEFIMYVKDLNGDILQDSSGNNLIYLDD